METIRITENDAAILYCIPIQRGMHLRGGNLGLILKGYFILHRAAPPPYDEFIACISKALAAGIVTVDNECIHLKGDWHERIHVPRDDELSQFNQLFLDKDWPVVCQAIFDSDEEDYQRVAKKEGSFSRDVDVTQFLSRLAAREVGWRGALNRWSSRLTETQAGLLIFICFIIILLCLIFLDFYD